MHAQRAARARFLSNVQVGQHAALMANSLAGRFSKMCCVNMGGAINPSQHSAPSHTPVGNDLALAQLTMCSSTNERIRLATNEVTIPNQAFFGLSPAGKPTRLIHRVLKT